MAATTFHPGHGSTRLVHKRFATLHDRNRIDSPTVRFYKLPALLSEPNGPILPILGCRDRSTLYRRAPVIRDQLRARHRRGLYEIPGTRREHHERRDAQ